MARTHCLTANKCRNSGSGATFSPSRAVQNAGRERARALSFNRASRNEAPV